MNYTCNWCGKEYEFTPEIHWGEGKKSNGSNMNKCPFCLQLNRTWRTEMTGNVTGRKHINIRDERKGGNK